jgi:hypothetical protein
MESPNINIDELYETKQKNDMNRLEIFNKLLVKIHSRIKYASRQRNSIQFCSYVMPEVLIGYPNYNLAECITFIMDRLNTNGFLTRYIHPNLLFISWNHWVPSYVREELKLKTGTEVDSFGVPVVKEDKTVVRFDKKPAIKSVSSYKPTGKYIYDMEMIDSMKK